jgi:sarcosine oxidase subunit gamma
MPEARKDPTARRLGPLAGVAVPERREVAGRIGVTLSVPAPVSLVGLEARRGRAVELTRRLAEAYGTVPEPRRAAGEAVTLLHVAPDTFLVLAEAHEEGALAAELRALVGATASVVDQSHGRTLIRLAGADARELLAYGTGLDVSPAAFGPGACAATLLGHIAATLHLRSSAPEVDILVSRAFAESLWHWLLGRARRFGYEVAAGKS